MDVSLDLECAFQLMLASIQRSPLWVFRSDFLLANSLQLALSFIGYRMFSVLSVLSHDVLVHLELPSL